MMIATVVIVLQTTLRVDRPAEFAPPDHKRFVQKPAHFKSRIKPVHG